MEKIFANNTSNKIFICRIHKESSKLNTDAPQIIMGLCPDEPIIS